MVRSASDEALILEVPILTVGGIPLGAALLLDALQVPDHESRHFGFDRGLQYLLGLFRSEWSPPAVASMRPVFH